MAGSSEDRGDNRRARSSSEEPTDAAARGKRSRLDGGGPADRLESRRGGADVYRFDRTLIDPTPEALDVTLAAAAEAANRGFRARLLAWPLDGFAEFVADWTPASPLPRRTELGQRQWLG